MSQALLLILAQTTQEGGRTWIEDAADIAGLVVGIAAVASLWIAARSVRELQKDRALRVRPRLVFDRGAQGVPYTARPITGIPGINRAFAGPALAAHPSIKKAVLTQGFWGKLDNYGNGSALNISVVFLTLEACVGGERFNLDAAKLSEFPYAPGLNSIPASPSHLHPGGSARFKRIPTPIYVGLDQGRDEIGGVVAITYADVFDTTFVTYQDFSAYLKEGTKEDPYVLLTFRDELSGAEAQQLLAPFEAAIPRELLPLAKAAEPPSWG